MIYTGGVHVGIETVRVEAARPVVQRLPVHSADAGGIAAAHAVKHGGEGQQATALGRVPGRLHQPPQRGR